MGAIAPFSSYAYGYAAVALGDCDTCPSSSMLNFSGHRSRRNSDVRLEMVPKFQSSKNQHSVFMSPLNYFLLVSFPLERTTVQILATALPVDGEERRTTADA